MKAWRWPPDAVLRLKAWGWPPDAVLRLATQVLRSYDDSLRLMAVADVLLHPSKVEMALVVVRYLAHHQLPRLHLKAWGHPPHS